MNLRNPQALLLVAIATLLALPACKRESQTPEPVSHALRFSETRAAADRPVPPPAPLPGDPTPTGPAVATSARILVYGDSGEANEAQGRLGKAMAAFCARERCEFAIHTGDIVYPKGVASADDPLLLSNFERPYGQLGVPIYLSLGNHEHYGSPDAMVAAWKPGSPARKRGLVDARLPARSYTFSRGGVRFVVLDTSQLDEAQGRWTDEVLARSRRAGERWVVAIGHHPLRSSGMHGNAVEGTLAWMVAHLCDKVDVYLSGHDHDKEVLSPHCGIHQVVSGAGAYVRPIEPKPGSIWSADTLGWAWIVMDDAKLVLTFHDEKGQLEARHTIVRQPR